MPKVHKQPLNLRPMVSCVNSFPAIFSKWLDNKMKRLLHLVPSYIKDSTDLLKELQNLNIPPGAKLFTADAIAMHTNINTETGINAIENILYKSVLNQFGTLWWNIDNLSRSTTFLDLQLTIKGNKIKTKTLQKPMKLYLYIPPLSAHPLGCFKSLITGELLRYWKQNSDPKDFIEITSLFIQRLLD
jgi:hypothetical protein